jgi:hypothetical protein
MSRAGSYNVVIVARNFNPTIFTQLWLVNQEIFSKHEVEQNYIFTPMAVNLTTEEVSFIAVPDRIQLGFINDKVDFHRLIDRILVKIVTRLPHTPFQAVGFNLAWLLSSNTPETFEKINREYFLSPHNPLLRYFSEKNCRFGGYLSKDVPIGRMRLDIKPLTVASPSGTSEALQLAFNFTRDLRDDDKLSQIINFLASWDTALSMSKEMMETSGKGWSN